MFCKNCGNEIQEDWSVCPNCGIKLKEENEKRNQDNEQIVKNVNHVHQNQNTPKKKKSKLKKVGINNSNNNNLYIISNTRVICYRYRETEYRSG